MHVVRAETAGFCMGVDLALKKLDATIEAYPQSRIVTLGPIIHNPHVLENYAKRGVVCLDGASLSQRGDCVLIRAHGIPQQEEQTLRATGARVVDATCPKVKKAQLAIGEATADGSYLLLFGESNHPEVRGLVSYAAAGALVFEGLEALQAQTLSTSRHHVLASQTTQDRKVFDAIEAYLRKIHPDIKVLSTICDATRQRQEEARVLAGQVQAMVVVGGRSSGNTRRLADVAQASGIPTWHVECVEELQAKKIATFTRIGLTAGASTPKSLIDAVQKFLEKL